MELFANLALGMATALKPANLAFALVGSLIGTLIGVLPGIGPLATLSMLLPITFYLEPITALIMLSAIYYGAQYGGSTTAILVNLPGESSSVVTCIDGHEMARQGRAGSALAIAALGSFFAGSVATVVIAALVTPLTALAITFSAAEYFSLMVLGLVAAVVMARGSVAKALAMIVIGLLLGLVGTDIHTGLQRFTFGSAELFDGIDFVSIAVGIFGFGSIIASLEKGEDAQTVSVLRAKLQRLWPTREDFRLAWPASLRGTILGCLLGVLPGGGAVLSSFAAYSLERKLAKDPARFGNGAVEGVAGPESANNAGAQTAFIPMLTLGIPPNAVMAVMIGAMMIHGIRPGPEVLEQRPDLFWGLIASMWIGNAMLVDHQSAADRMWVRLLRVPVSAAVPGDPAVQQHRHLQRAQQQLRGRARGGLRRVRLPAVQARLRAGAARAGFRARPDAGGEVAHRHAARTRQSDHVPAATDQRRPAADGGRVARRRCCCRKSARGGRRRFRSSAATPRACRKLERGGLWRVINAAQESRAMAKVGSLVAAVAVVAALAITSGAQAKGGGHGRGGGGHHAGGHGKIHFGGGRHHVRMHRGFSRHAFHRPRLGRGARHADRLMMRGRHGPHGWPARYTTGGQRSRRHSAHTHTIDSAIRTALPAGLAASFLARPAARAVAWPGPLFWSHGGDDVFWPTAYDAAFWDYGTADMLGGILLAAYGGRSRYAAPRRGLRDDRAFAREEDAGAILCRDQPSDLTNLAAVEQEIRPTEAQRTAFDQLRTTEAAATEIIRGACPVNIPPSPTARREVMAQWVDAILVAVRMVRPPLEASTARSTTSRRRGRFTILGQRRERGDTAQACVGGWRSARRFGQRAG